MRLEPATFPLTVTRLPFACFGKISCDMPVITSGYSSPVRTVKIKVKRNPGPSSLIIACSFSRQTQRGDDLVNQPNTGEGDNHSAQTIDEEISAQHLASTDRFVLNTAECQRN